MHSQQVWVDYLNLESIKRGLETHAPNLRVDDDFTQEMLVQRARDKDFANSLVRVPFLNAYGVVRDISVSDVFYGKNKHSTRAEKEKVRLKMMDKFPKGEVVLNVREHDVINTVSIWIGVKFKILREMRLFDFAGPRNEYGERAYGQMAVSVRQEKSGVFQFRKTASKILEYLEHGGMVFMAVVVVDVLECAYVIKPSDRAVIAEKITSGNVNSQCFFMPSPFSKKKLSATRFGAASLNSILAPYLRISNEDLIKDLVEYFVTSRDSPRRPRSFLNEDSTMISVSHQKESAYIRRLRASGLSFHTKDFGSGNGGGDIQVIVRGEVITVELKKAIPLSEKSDSYDYTFSIRRTGGLPLM